MIVDTRFEGRRNHLAGYEGIQVWRNGFQCSPVRTPVLDRRGLDVEGL